MAPSDSQHVSCGQQRRVGPRGRAAVLLVACAQPEPFRSHARNSSTGRYSQFGNGDAAQCECILLRCCCCRWIASVRHVDPSSAAVDRGSAEVFSFQAGLVASPRLRRWRRRRSRCTGGNRISVATHGAASTAQYQLATAEKSAQQRPWPRGRCLFLVVRRRCCILVLRLRRQNDLPLRFPRQGWRVQVCRLD